MVRPILTELALFLAPFAAYALFLWATRADVLHPSSWPRSTLAWLTISAFGLVVVSFFLVAQFSGAPPGSTYVPAHMENGKFVPGTTK
ncbi:MAG TPA: DUF6111 family protein [Xanthobacteraceae bacterium]|jgi:hypothetical protein|nr:DUF6111 family protein [Xanthobacteraceae bacterium]